MAPRNGARSLPAATMMTGARAYALGILTPGVWPLTA